MSTNAPDSTSRLSRSRIARWSLAGLGIVCVAIGAIGVFVPGLPTTIFLIAAVWCFTKSCPYLECLLVRNRLFAPFLRYVDRTEAIPVQTKVRAIIAMWIFVTLSCAIFVSRDNVPAWPALLITGAACIGTVAIARWDARLRRPPTSSAPVSVECDGRAAGRHQGMPDG